MPAETEERLHVEFRRRNPSIQNNNKIFQPLFGKSRSRNSLYKKTNLSTPWSRWQARLIKNHLALSASLNHLMLQNLSPRRRSPEDQVHLQILGLVAPNRNLPKARDDPPHHTIPLSVAGLPHRQILASVEDRLHLYLPPPGVPDHLHPSLESRNDLDSEHVSQMWTESRFDRSN